MKFDSRAAIGLRPARAVPRIPGPVKYTTMHYNGPRVGITPRHSHEVCRRFWRMIQAFHMDDRGWSDIAYNTGSCPHGFVLAGRGKYVRSAANGTNEGNNTAYANMLLVGESEEPTQDMYKAARESARLLGAPQLVPHSFWKGTGCPGDPTRGWILAGAPIEEDLPEEEEVTQQDKEDIANLVISKLAGDVRIDGRNPSQDFKTIRESMRAIGKQVLLIADATGAVKSYQVVLEGNDDKVNV